MCFKPLPSLAEWGKGPGENYLMSGEVWGKSVSVRKLRIESLFVLSSQSYGLFLWLRSRQRPGDAEMSLALSSPGTPRPAGKQIRRPSVASLEDALGTQSSKTIPRDLE